MPSPAGPATGFLQQSPAVHRGKAVVQWKEMSGVGTAATRSWEDSTQRQRGLRQNGDGGGGGGGSLHR